MGCKHLKITSKEIKCLKFNHIFESPKEQCFRIGEPAIRCPLKRIWYCIKCGFQIVLIPKKKKVFGNLRECKVAYCMQCKKERNFNQMTTKR